MIEEAPFRGPSPHALAGFAAGQPARPLAGGMGVAWRAGDVVLKPSPEAAQAHCLAETHAALGATPGCRVQRPMPAPQGGWTIDGWAAWTWIQGETAPEHARDIVLAGRAYHRALAPLPCDAALLGRDDPWARADRVAWGEAAVDYPSEYRAMLAPLLAGPLPTLAAQRVHADLTGNVVFADGLLSLGS